jgi:hypothetical protein
MRAILVFLILESLATIHSAIIRNPKTDKCLDGSSGSGKELLQKKCSPGSPSQTWNVTHYSVMAITLEGSRKCVGLTASGSVFLMNCNPSKEELAATKARVKTFLVLSNNDAHKLTIRGTGIQKCITLLAEGHVEMETCGNAEGNDSQDVFYE